MKLTKEQREFLNQTWDGTEYCIDCDMETDFIFNPMESEYITCSHCGKKIHPCSLCDGSQCASNTSCIEAIRETLLRENCKLKDTREDGIMLINEIDNDRELDLYNDLLPLAYNIYKSKTNGMVCGSEAEKIRDKMFKAIKDTGILNPKLGVIELTEDGYIYRSKNGIEYELLEAMSIGIEPQKTTDFIIIMLIGTDYDVKNHLVGWVPGAGVLTENIYTYEIGIGNIVDAYEEENGLEA